MKMMASSSAARKPAPLVKSVRALPKFFSSDEDQLMRHVYARILIFYIVSTLLKSGFPRPLPRLWFDFWSSFSKWGAFRSYFSFDIFSLSSFHRSFYFIQVTDDSLTNTLLIIDPADLFIFHGLLERYRIQASRFFFPSHCAAEEGCNCQYIS